MGRLSVLLIFSFFIVQAVPSEFHPDHDNADDMNDTSEQVNVFRLLCHNQLQDQQSINSSYKIPVFVVQALPSEFHPDLDIAEDMNNTTEQVEFFFF